MGFDAFALVYVDDNPGVPGSENDFFITFIFVNNNCSDIDLILF